MEAINKTIENALHFIAVIQDNCDRNRFLIEQLNLKCYKTYLKEWKTEQKEVKKAHQKTCQINNCTNKEETEAGSEELEELMLADLLLEKARSIRCKNIAFLKHVELKSTSLSSNDSSSNNIKSDLIVSSENKDFSGILRTKKNNHSLLLRSKSAMTSVPMKTSQITHSKSCSENILKKDRNFLKPTPSTNLKTGANTDVSSSLNHSLPKGSNVSVISKEQFSELKNMSANHEQQKSCLSETLQNGKDHRSDSPQSAIHHPFLTYRSFKDDLKSISNLKQSFQLRKDRFWYPYMNNKNRSYLSEQTKCNTFESVSKVIKLVHKIQEIMFWIDLMSLLGREVLPSLKVLDENNKNVIRLCSYLSSIYQENLQRQPMLNLD